MNGGGERIPGSTQKGKRDDEERTGEDSLRFTEQPQSQETGAIVKAFVAGVTKTIIEDVNAADIKWLG